MKLTVCLEMFFRDLPFAERIAAIRRAGYDAGEFWGHANKDLPAVAAACREHGVHITSMSAFGINPGLNDPSVHDDLIRHLREAIKAASVVGCRRLIVLSGNVLKGKTRCEQGANIIRGLRRMAPIAADAGVTLVLELLNSLVDHPNYFLDNSEDMAYVIRGVDHPNIKALYDIYHGGIMEGNVIEKIRANIDCIGHFHAAGIPGRHEMVDGEQNYPVICRAIDAAGFDGYVGLEYTPLKDPHDSLVETRRWLGGS
jgi:hydroxypyruvate isomerase